MKSGKMFTIWRWNKVSNTVWMLLLADSFLIFYASKNQSEFVLKKKDF
jgi:hypothetical protein